MKYQMQSRTKHRDAVEEIKVDHWGDMPVHDVSYLIKERADESSCDISLRTLRHGFVRRQRRWWLT